MKYPRLQSHSLAGVGVIRHDARTEKTVYLCRRESAARSRKENVKQILQTFNPAQPDFNMRQHIARCTLRPSLEVQALKVSPERSFGGGGSPKSNLLKYSCHEEKDACKQ